MSTSTKDNSAMSIPTNNTHKKKGLTRDTAVPRRASGPNDCFNPENTDGSFKPEPGSPGRSSCRSRLRTLSSSPTRANLSPIRPDTPSPSRRTSPRRSSHGSSRAGGPGLSGESTLGAYPRESQHLKGCILLKKLSRSLVDDPVKTSSPGPVKQNKGDTVVNSSRSGATTNRMVPKNTKGPYPARGKPAEAGPSVVTPLDMIDGPSTFAHGAELGSVGDSMFNPILIPSDEPELEIAPADYNAVLSSPSTEKEDTSLRKRSKRAREEDDSEGRVTILGAKINKQRKLNASKTVSPRDPSDARHLGSNIGSQVLYPFGFEAPVDSEPSKGNPVVNDSSSSRLVDNDKSQTNSIILPDWIEAIDCKSAEFAAAELNAGDYFLDAFIALIEYTHTLDDAKSSLGLVREARHEMAEAWGLWRTVAMAHVNLSVLQHYGSALDAEGKRALAAALKVESDQLEGWFDEPRRVANPTLEVEESSPGPLSQGTEPPCYTHGPPSLFFTPVSGPAPAGLYSNPLTTVAISSAPTPKRSSNVNRNRNLPPLLAALSSSVAATATTSTAQEITFGKTPTARIIPQKGHQPGHSSGDLPRWTKGFDYCDSYADLVQWVQSRHAHFARPISSSFPPFQGMTTKEEGQVVDELTDGKGLAHTFTRDESRQFERRAYAVLPPEQLPLLLDGDVATHAYRGSEEAPPFTLVCRANFYVDWEKGITYRDRICGTTFRTDESAIRHIRERHLTVNRPRASKAKRSTKKKYEDNEDDDTE